MLAFSDKLKHAAIDKYRHVLHHSSAQPVSVHLHLSHDEPFSTRHFDDPQWHTDVFNTRFDSASAHYLIFSDDVTLAAEYMHKVNKLVPGLMYTLIEFDIASSLYLSTQCMHHVLTSSLVGFWGAYLSPYQTARALGRVVYSVAFARAYGEGVIPFPERWEAFG